MRIQTLAIGLLLLAGACATDAAEDKTAEATAPATPDEAARAAASRAQAQQRCGPVEAIQMRGTSGVAPGDYVCQREQGR